MITFKEMNLNDLDEMVAMYIETFNSEPWNDEWTYETAYKRLHAMINVEDFYGICAYKDNTMCGMVLGCKEQYYNGIMFNLREFCVKNSLRGLGLGQTILKEFEKRLKKLGVTEMNLLTMKNAKTEGFYEKCEYKPYDFMIMMGKEL